MTLPVLCSAKILIITALSDLLTARPAGKILQSEGPTSYCCHLETCARQAVVSLSYLSSIHQ